MPKYLFDAHSIDKYNFIFYSLYNFSFVTITQHSFTSPSHPYYSASFSNSSSHKASWQKCPYPPGDKTNHLPRGRQRAHRTRPAVPRDTCPCLPGSVVCCSHLLMHSPLPAAPPAPVSPRPLPASGSRWGYYHWSMSEGMKLEGGESLSKHSQSHNWTFSACQADWMVLSNPALSHHIGLNMEWKDRRIQLLQVTPTSIRAASPCSHLYKDLLLSFI